jgi:hypothetical protein
VTIEKISSHSLILSLSFPHFPFDPVTTVFPIKSDDITHTLNLPAKINGYRKEMGKIGASFEGCLSLGL